MPSKARSANHPSCLRPLSNITAHQSRRMTLTASESARLAPNPRPSLTPTLSSVAETNVFTSAVDLEKAAEEMRVKILKNRVVDRKTKKQEEVKVTRRKALFSEFEKGFKGTARPTLPASRSQRPDVTNTSKATEVLPRPHTMLATKASTAPALSTPLDQYLATIEEDICHVSDYLRAQVALGNMPTSLPDFTIDDKAAVDGERDVPWSAKQLIKLYILSFHVEDYHTCDLVIDTWIRAFQNVQEKGRNLWQPSKIHKDGKDDKGGERVVDIGSNPMLNKRVTTFDPRLLHDLYTFTAPRSGARVFWADNIALCGKGIEPEMGKYKEQWHPDLIFEVMQTSLRLVRSRLTLKIEEKSPEEWCNRYHEHGKKGLPCYRDIAQEQQLAASELKHSRKRSRDENDNGSNSSKRSKVNGAGSSSEED